MSAPPRPLEHDHQPPPAATRTVSVDAAITVDPTVRPAYLAAEWDPARRQVHLHAVSDADGFPLSPEGPAPLVTLRKRAAIELRDELNAIFPPTPKHVPPGRTADDRLIGIIENLTKDAR